MKRRVGRMLSLLPTGFCLLSPGACRAQDRTPDTPALPHAGQTVSLTLLAYNYTDHYIDNYSVDGIGGSNVRLSTPAAGGGGGTCCVRWTVGRSLPVTVHVRWVSSECLYTEREAGQDFLSVKNFWSEQDVQLTQPPPANPLYFETHFYRDGHIEVAITDDYTPPRLKLPVTKRGLRPGVPDWPRCTAEQLQQGED